jgi:hypothetical protein
MRCATSIHSSFAWQFPKGGVQIDAEIGYKGNTGSVRLVREKLTHRKIRKSNMRFLDERIGGVCVADRQAHPLRQK